MSLHARSRTSLLEWAVSSWVSFVHRVFFAAVYRPRILPLWTTRPIRSINATFSTSCRVLLYKPPKFPLLEDANDRTAVDAVLPGDSDTKTMVQDEENNDRNQRLSETSSNLSMDNVLQFRLEILEYYNHTTNNNNRTGHKDDLYRRLMIPENVRQSPDSTRTRNAVIDASNAKESIFHTDTLPAVHQCHVFTFVRPIKLLSNPRCFRPKRTVRKLLDILATTDAPLKESPLFPRPKRTCKNCLFLFGHGRCDRDIEENSDGLCTCFFSPPQ